MASKAIDSTNNIDVRKFCIDLMPEINLYPFYLPSIALADLDNIQIFNLQSLLYRRDWDPLEGLVFYGYWIWTTESSNG